MSRLPFRKRKDNNNSNTVNIDDNNNADDVNGNDNDIHDEFERMMNDNKNNKKKNLNNSKKKKDNNNNDINGNDNNNNRTIRTGNVTSSTSAPIMSLHSSESGSGNGTIRAAAEYAPRSNINK
jgi:hypothetical protein